MTNRRISIHDYPEHLNPFNEFYNDGAESGHKTKYYTWSTAGKHKIKHAILDKPWSAMSPSKLGRRLSFIKAITIDKLSPSKNKQKVKAVESSNSLQSSPSRHSTPEEPFLIISPKQKEKIKRLAQLPSNHIQENDSLTLNGSPSPSRYPDTSTLPTRRKLSIQENGTTFDDSPSNLPKSLSNDHQTDSQMMSNSSQENESSYSQTGARPKPRKKRVAPPPPPQQSSKDVSMDMGIMLATHQETSSITEDIKFLLLEEMFTFMSQEMDIGCDNLTEYEHSLSTFVDRNSGYEIDEVFELHSKESNISCPEDPERSASPDDSITQILEQDAIMHSDTETEQASPLPKDTIRIQET